MIHGWAIFSRGSCIAFFLLVGCLPVESELDQPTEAELVRLSVDGSGVGGDGASGNSVAISADGMLVAFDSEASNLVADDTNAVNDIFLVDRRSGKLVRLSISALGIEGNGPSDNVALSADGATVAFTSEASNLTDGDTNGLKDLFVRDLASGKIINVAPAYGEVLLSDDGKVVAFTTNTNLHPGDTDTRADAYLFDRSTNKIEWLSKDTPPGTTVTAIDGSGRTVAVTSGMWYDTNFQLWLYDRPTATASLVGLASSSVCPQHGELSTDGRRMVVVACPDAGNPFDWSPWVIDLSGPVEKIDPLQGIPRVDYSIARISGDGAYAMVSTSVLKDGSDAELVSVELATGAMKKLSSPSNGAAYRFDTNYDGGRTVFTSTATDLVPEDINNYADVFIRVIP